MTVHHRLRSSIAIPGIALLLAGCVSAEQAALYADPKAGFSTVSATTSSLTKGKRTVWIQGQEGAREMPRVQLLSRKDDRRKPPFKLRS